MRLSIRSGMGALARRSTLRAPGLRAWEIDTAAFRSVAGLATLAACCLLVPPAQAIQYEPEPEPVAQDASAPETDVAPAAASETKTKPEALSDDAELREPNWIPAIDLGFETFDYNTDTAVRNFINPPAWQSTQSEAERQLMFRIGGELMGPAFEELPGQPRLFVQGGVLFQTFSSDKILGVGDPFVPLEPERKIQDYNAFGDNGRDLPSFFVGQGSEISARFQSPSWYAGLGVAFSVPIATNLLLYLKPSIQYSLEKIDLPAGLTTVHEPVPMLDPLDGCGNAVGGKPPCNREFFVHRSRASATATDHSVGLGLEVALVPFRFARPIRVTLYAGARFLWLVSDDTTTYGDSGGVASFTVMRDQFNLKGGGGLRFSWVGFD